MPKPAPRPYFQLRGHEGSVTSLHFTTRMELFKNQPVLFSGSEKGEIFVWNLKTCRTHHRFKGHTNNAIVFLYYHKTSLLSQGKDGIINRWEYVAEWIVTETIPTNSRGFCPAVLLPVGDAAYLFYLSDNERIIQIGRLEGSYHISIESKDLGMCFCIKPLIINGMILVLGGFENGCVAMFDCESEICRLQLENPVICMDYDSEHKCMGMSGTVNDVIETFKVTEEMKIIKVKTIKMNTVKEVGASNIKIRPDGKIVLVSGVDAIIRIYSWKTLKLLALLTFHELPIQSLAFCPVPIKEVCDERKSVIASGCKDCTISLWDVY